MNTRAFLVSVVFGVLSAAPASASIGINFYGPGTAQPNQLAPASMAGFISDAHWNNMTISNIDGNGHWNGGQVAGTLTDDTGAVVPGLTVTVGGEAYMNYNLGGSRASAQSWPMNGAGGTWGGSGTWEVIENGGIWPSSYINVAGVPYSAYSVFVYIVPNVSSSAGSGTIAISAIGGGTVDLFAADGNYSYAWDPNAWTLGNNCVEFTGNSASSFELACNLDHASWGGVAAIEILSAPEPASLALLGIGSVLVLFRREMFPT
jgi:hypothetical protein